MDEQLVSLMKTVGVSARSKPGARPSGTLFLDIDKGQIALGPEEQKQEYSLKPLSELFGKGSGLETLDPTDEQFTPLLMPIEEAIVEYWRQNPSLTDGQTALVLEELAMDPAGLAHNDLLKQAIQFRLRLTLSLNDYSRQEVKMAIRKISKSVQRHTRLAGPRGYLRFISQMLTTGTY